MWDALLDAFLDTLNIIPILFLVYLTMEFVSHGNSFGSKSIGSRKFGPLIGSCLGLFPQCGFSSAMADLYSKKTITIGTLFAVFIATSDEAIVILLAHPKFFAELLLFIAIKFVYAVIIGYVVDLVTHKLRYKNIKDTTPHFHNHCECNILHEALVQTLQISLFVFVATFIVNSILLIFPIEALTLSGNKIIQPIFASLIGLIPNCASSIFLVELYINKVLYFGSLVGALSAGSGVGLLVLFRKNKNIKQNILITLGLFACGTFLGILLNLFL